MAPTEEDEGDETGVGGEADPLMEPTAAAMPSVPLPCLPRPRLSRGSFSKTHFEVQTAAAAGQILTSPKFASPGLRARRKGP